MKLNKIFFSISLIISTTIASMENGKGAHVYSFSKRQMHAIEQYFNEQIRFMTAHTKAAQRNINETRQNLEKTEEALAASKATNEAVKAKIARAQLSLQIPAMIQSARRELRAAQRQAYTKSNNKFAPQKPH